MIYSCFDPSKGLYVYYETKESKPINADLSVPKLEADTGNIGVPASIAGRELPSDAKKVGEGWHARGIVAEPRKSALSGLGEFVAPPAWKWAVGLALVGVTLYAVDIFTKSKMWKEA